MLPRLSDSEVHLDHAAMGVANETEFNPELQSQAAQ